MAQESEKFPTSNVRSKQEQDAIQKRLKEIIRKKNEAMGADNFEEAEKEVENLKQNLLKEGVFINERELQGALEDLEYFKPLEENNV
ncbi:MAG: hypothetical protein AAB631_00660 [Patescibacteria group bacterium]